MRGRKLTIVRTNVIEHKFHEKRIPRLKGRKLQQFLVQVDLFHKKNTQARGRKPLENVLGSINDRYKRRIPRLRGRNHCDITSNIMPYHRKRILGSGDENKTPS